MRILFVVLAFLFVVLVLAASASAQIVSTNMRSAADVVGLAGGAVSLAALAIGGSLVVWVGWLVYQVLKKVDDDDDGRPL